ncbi:MAG: 30S ribosomal protein S8 [Bdellovibrionales bacterium RIFOXYD12_FULL_39_22]|nr:MAG: 30S ribosomal protein S8 [Bdellovibrionales bacterium RIFOXYB1_FULL_39_21]OFZ43371.1 MAG: 30S ribosomal protein S8 [Bdellovibrionales bacterium RIFOXYC12_FULL_39_17]OFZ47404.1 MAG: 30S ribosomal protein S8 [Bdellovibrionales bacterium RIFOXYC1_FULL_39_130]OFZ73852.1 MAG: 30S ribosomal protein S8 [Bdellovibrionales bacterium RIFOXYC2_FULL_39_8]OFZ76284.1 MAG: 30S ribosomal protein S8 [Bdellovibrionales bacterium RIFOXYD1_FULL_39_84]OFZ94322.1 MAG: 30S ribosomal protein S8 [Bdellovibrion
MMTDPIADMLTRIRNAIKAGEEKVDFPASKIKAAICKVLKDEGYIRSFKIVAKSQSDVTIRVALKEGAIVGLKRVSTPGLRQYRGCGKMPRVLSGLGIAILSTSKGILSSRDAKTMKVGGEVLCSVW